jgi:Glycosyl transferases group 1
MRIFQNTAATRSYAPILDRRLKKEPDFAGKVGAILESCTNRIHILLPVISGTENAFYTHGDNIELQRCWAHKKGLPATADLEEILLAQIEEHRTEVFYNFDWAHFDSKFAKRLPGSVKAQIGWYAAPPIDADMTGYLIVCNFPTLLKQYQSAGLRCDYFAPAHDPFLDAAAGSGSDDRDIDVLFVGGYSRYHTRRAPVLEAVAGLANKYNITFGLDRSRVTRLAETPLGWLGPLRKHRRPAAVRKAAQDPVFGREYYNLLSRAKIVLNGAGDIGGDDRGNMRCWEAMGARSLLLSDAGVYPSGMVDNETMRTYNSAHEATEIIEDMLSNTVERERIANAGYEMIRTSYSKAAQWDDFQRLVAKHF